MNDQLSVFLAGGLLAVGCLGFYMYSNKEDNEGEDDDYDSELDSYLSDEDMESLSDEDDDEKDFVSRKRKTNNNNNNKKTQKKKK